MQYDCRIEDDLLICTLTADRDIAAPVFCFSGMAPLAPVSGGTLQKSIGSYTEVLLPDLKADQPHEVKIRYQGGYRPANRAWMPLGPFLMAGSEIIRLPPTPAGRNAPPPPAPRAIDGLPIIPQPDQWMPKGGTLQTNGFRSDHPAIDAVAALAKRQGLRFQGEQDLQVITADMADDAYIIDIAPDGVTITAAGYGGTFYAGVTLLGLLQHGPLPCGRIKDTPRFEWRGQHLDTARHYYQPQTIYALLDLMALLKLNRFHWHFADDEAFRLEIESVPALWQKTALRGLGQPLPGLFSGSPVEGGSYSRACAESIIAHAKSLNIEILPEVEAPAHALAITVLFPDTRDPDDTGTERSVQGYAGNAMNPAMPKTWELLDAIVTEVGAIFPFGHIHLGCDELPKDTWMGSPKARALMADHDLDTTKDLQGWTMAKLAATVSANGHRPAAWEEAAQGKNGGIGHDAILFSWTGQGPGLDAACAGYDVVMTPGQHVYLDMAHTSDPDDWGASWAAFVDLADTVAWDPVPDPALADRIIGVQGTFWSEFTTQDSQIWPMLMPRLLGVAAMAWQSSPPSAQQLYDLATRYGIGDDGRVMFRTMPDAD